jgi:hypothetical protein
MSKPLGGSPRGGLTHDGGTPGVSKLSKGKPMDFESQGGQGTGEEAWGSKLLGQTVHGVRPQEARMLGKGLGGRVISPWGGKLETSFGEMLRWCSQGCRPQRWPSPQGGQAPGEHSVFSRSG